MAQKPQELRKSNVIGVVLNAVEDVDSYWSLITPTDMAWDKKRDKQQRNRPARALSASVMMLSRTAFAIVEAEPAGAVNPLDRTGRGFPTLRKTRSKHV